MPPFDRFVADADGPHGLWRVVAGAVVIGAFWIGGTAAVLGGYLGVLLASGVPLEAARATLAREVLSAAAGPAGLCLVLATFWGIWLGTGLALRILHRRPLASLLGPARVREFITGFALAIGAFAVSILLGAGWGGLPERTEVPVAAVLLWLPVIALLVVVQAGGEELIFRGYLGQELARRSKNPIVWAVIPSALFGSLHYQSGLPEPLGLLYVAVTFLFGLAACALVWRTGALWAAIGLHTGLNLPGLTLVSLDLEGALPGTQLFQYPPEGAVPLFAADAIVSAGLLLWLLSPFSPLRART